MTVNPKTAVLNGDIGSIDATSHYSQANIPNKGIPIRLVQDLNRDNQKHVRRHTAPRRSLKGIVGSRTRFKAI